MTFHSKFLKLVVDRKARHRKRFPSGTSAREETLRIKLTVKSNHFSYNMMKPSYQSRITLKFIKSMDQRRSLIRIIAIKLFIEIEPGGGYGGKKFIEAEVQCQNR